MEESSAKAYDTWDSQAVSDPSTNQARRCLTCQIGRDGVRSAWYGHSSLQGVYRKQSGSLHLESLHGRDPVLYDQIVITPTSISDYGECYSKYGDSYVLGLKRMGRTICYRCVTPILLSRNVLHMAQQAEGVCHETEQAASMTCFDAMQVTLADGFLMFRSERRELSDCGFNGKFAVEYTLNNAKLSCEQNSGTIIINDNHKQHTLLIQFSNDSSCAHLTEKHAYENYVFKYESESRPFAPCHFADWLHGDYDSLTVGANRLVYHQSSGSGVSLASTPSNGSPVPIVSHCVHHYPDRIFVYSETKCGEPLGYHCLQFVPRSENLMEFRTTLPVESAATNSNDSICMDESSFANAPWTTALVTDPIAVSCGILGSYRTPQTDSYLNGDCYNVTFDCQAVSKMTITAYHCRSGAVFDSRSYTCTASWKDNQYLFIYAMQQSDVRAHTCFISSYQNGKLFLASSGTHCARDFNFTQNAERTMVLEEESGCANQQVQLQIPKIIPPHLRRPKPVVVKTFPMPTTESATTPMQLPTSPYARIQIAKKGSIGASEEGDEWEWKWTKLAAPKESFFCMTISIIISYLWHL
ncbi:hypothetical protein WR25_23490 [Diploscapter pachys]|uniref:Uncharacterized protein n=1 Tax=Diploscapter pachys TaxID=2018661 RepID=A0A2A2L8U3_9BILA|nr:hypothetical protein WR25_23490 [Diploscapter pachys]